MWPPLAASINMVEPSCEDKTIIVRTKLVTVVTNTGRQFNFKNDLL